MVFSDLRSITSAIINHDNIPQTIPSEIDNVKGIKIIVIKAGIDSRASFQFTNLTEHIIKLPTMTNAGATTNNGTIMTRGARNKNGRKSNPTTTETNPVRPPAVMPVADST